MISNAANTARIGPITGTGDISGNVIVQRFAPGGVTGWALLGTPIASGLTLNDWDDDIPISCSTCPDGSAAGFLSIYTYDETKPGLFDDYAGYIPLSGINDPITPNKGYWVYLGTNLNTTTDITLDVTGPVRKFSNTIPLSYTSQSGSDNDGWNLIHNPYPSPISWTALRNGNTNVENAIYTYNADINAYASYVNGVSSPAGMLGDAIPMGQGFYVHALAPTSLVAQETNKIGGNPVFLKSTSGNTQQTVSNIPTLRLNLLGASNRKDETVLYMQTSASNSFDAEYDAVKLVGQDLLAPALALKQGNDLFQINGVNTITSNFSMPVRATTGYPGTYTISLSNFNSFPAGACISLLDTYNNQITNLKNSNYIFTLSDTTNYPRFVLNITIDPLSITSNFVNPSCASTDAGYITAKGTNAGPWNYYWKDVNGNSLKTSFNKSTADTLYNLNGGNYVLDINTVGMCDNNQSEYTIDYVESTNAFFVCEDTLLVSNGTSVYFDNQSVNAISYTWNFGDGSATSNEQFPIHEYMNIGTYTVTLITESNTGCMDTMTQKIEVIDNTTSIVNMNDNSTFIIKTLSSSQYQLEINKHDFNEVEFLVYDIYGKQVLNLGKHKEDSIILPIDLDKFSNGIYLLNINADNHWSKTIKLTVSK
jgi:PKD repeat protein